MLGRCERGNYVKGNYVKEGSLESKRGEMDICLMPSGWESKWGKERCLIIKCVDWCVK